MKRIGIPLKTNAQRYALAGAVFGLIFPIVASIIRILNAGLPLRFSSVITVHINDPLLWIIDTAPIFLGFFASLAGRRQDDLEKTNSVLRAREQELETTQLALEERVKERTRELTTMNLLVAERAEQLSLVADTSRSLLSIQELDRLLPLIVQVISQRFKYYQVGIYLLDEQKQQAILMASSSEGGLRIMKRGQQFRLGEQSLIDFVIRSGKPRIINEVSADTPFRPEPEFADTCAELVLPLKSGEKVLGVLDLQSDMPKIFTEEYVSVISILADLVTIAIQNSILHETTQRALHEVQVNSRQISAREWDNWAKSIQAKGYRYDGIRAERLKESKGLDSERQNIQNIPIRLRGRTIGNLKIKLSDASPVWTEDEHAIAEATADRAALALEGARLLEDAKRRAAREAFLSDMAAKLGASFRLDSILRDTVEELGHTLDDSTVSFQLVDPTVPPTTGSAKFDIPTAKPKDSE